MASGMASAELLIPSARDDESLLTLQLLTFILSSFDGKFGGCFRGCCGRRGDFGIWRPLLLKIKEKKVVSAKNWEKDYTIKEELEWSSKHKYFRFFYCRINKFSKICEKPSSKQKAGDFSFIAMKYAFMCLIVFKAMLVFLPFNHRNNSEAEKCLGLLFNFIF